MGSLIDSLETPTGTCQFEKDYDSTSVTGYELFAVTVSCPSRPTRIIKAEIVDTESNWAATDDHCGNVLHSESTDGLEAGMVRRTYLIWANAGTNTFAFSRPDDLPSIVVENSDFALWSSSASDAYTATSVDFPRATCHLKYEFGCEEDSSTPQECLNYWAHTYTPIKTPRDCYIDTYPEPNVPEGFAQWEGEDYYYIMVVGGCDVFDPDRSANVGFDLSNWDEINVSSAAYLFSTE